MATYAVTLDVPVRETAAERAGPATVRLYEGLAEWRGRAVTEARVDSELHRRRRVARVRLSMTARGADPAAALAAAVGMLRDVMGTDTRVWDLGQAAVTVQPGGPLRPDRRPARP